jgi:hypothetical protein
MHGVANTIFKEKVMKKSLWCLLVICNLYLLSGCGSGGGAQQPQLLVATHFSVSSATVTSTVGAPFNVTVTALDASNQVVTTYAGTVHLSSSDPKAVLPANAPLSSGTGTFSLTFKTAAPGATIDATDTVTSALTGSSTPINVLPGAAARLAVTAANAVTIGIPFSIAVTAFDTSNNVATSYSGVLHFSSTDHQAVLPPDSKLTNGTGSFQVTLKTVTSSSVMVADTVTASLSASTPISVVSNAATHFVLTVPSNSATRAPFGIAVTALDAANNTSFGYAGTVHFTSSDMKAILPTDSMLTAGVRNFTATLESPGSQTITAADATSALTQASSPIVVASTPALAISSNPPPNGTVGVTYGSVTTQIFQCVIGRRGSIVCTPCNPTTCNSLPPCGGGRFPCRETRTVFVGFAFTAVGGIPPYRWSATSLPFTLTLNPQNGEITGTPTVAATYNIAVTVTDAGSPAVQTTANFSLVISNPQPPVINTSPAPSTGAVNIPYSFAFTATGTATPLSWRISAGTPPAGLSLSTAGLLSGTPTAAGTPSITLIAQDSFNQDSAPQAFTIDIFAHGFKPTASMAAVRVAHTATLLNTGKVLVAGGTDATSKPLASAELYDPASGTFSSTGSMATARAHFAATLLPSGKVLVTGGLDTNGNPLMTAEIYDPGTGTFSATTGAMQFVHASHTATLLPSGKVLVIGWGNAVAELFDPVTGTFAQTGSMVKARVSHTATLLSSGKVLVTGGIGGVMTVLTEAELYDPTTGSFSPTLGSMATARQWHTASLLASGKVLVTGGLQDNANKALATAELFDPGTQSFTTTTGSIATARAFQTATVLKDGTVLVTGGTNGTAALATAEVYVPITETFSAMGGMASARQSHAATLLPDGRVLVTGGLNATGVLATAELYQ